MVVPEASASGWRLRSTHFPVTPCATVPPGGCVIGSITEISVDRTMRAPSPERNMGVSSRHAARGRGVPIDRTHGIQARQREEACRDGRDIH